MPIVIAVWKNNTISVVRMPVGFSMLDLFFELDNEHSPLIAKCYQVSCDEDGMHITFDWKVDSDDPAVGPATKGIGLGKICGKIKRIRWPKDIERQAWRALAINSRRHGWTESLRFLSSKEIPKMPAPPPPTHTVAQVRAMQSFCGVYLSYDEDGTCHYVGESEDVTTRVSRSRPEIGNRMIGFVRCAKQDRKIIESYFVAILDPPGNAISTHRMSTKTVGIAGGGAAEVARDEKGE